MIKWDKHTTLVVITVLIKLGGATFKNVSKRKVERTLNPTQVDSEIR